MQKITPFLWFEDNAEEAVTFYPSILENSKVVHVSRFGESGPKGTVMVMTYELESQQFTVLNGGPQFKLSPAISLVVNCKTQEEIDRFWVELSEGGETQPCGAVRDEFGVSRQVVPTMLAEMMRDETPGKSQNVLKALRKMDKLDIESLKRAYDGAPLRGLAGKSGLTSSGAAF